MARHLELGFTNAKFTEVVGVTRSPDGHSIGATDPNGEKRILWLPACQPLPKNARLFSLVGNADRRLSCSRCREMQRLFHLQPADDTFQKEVSKLRRNP